MSDDEEIEKMDVEVDGEFLPAGTEKKDIRTLPRKGIGSAIFSTFGHNLRTAEMEAKKKSLNALADCEIAEAEVYDAVLIKEKAVKQLLDADKIHEADARKRNAYRTNAETEELSAEARRLDAEADLKRAKQNIKDQEHKEDIAEFWRKAEANNLENAKDDLQSMVRDDELGLSEIEKELWQRFKATADPVRVDMLIELFFKQYNVTEEQKASIIKLAEDFKKANS